jgi:hypothetical protein
MKMRAIILVSAAFFVAARAPRLALGRTSQLPTEPNNLRSFLQKGYAAARSILEDVQMEYQHEQILRVDRAVLQEIFEFELKETTSYTVVETYLRKHGKERWAFLHIGSSPPTEDVSPRVGQIGTRHSPRFKVFDGQRILDYLPTKADGATSVGRATLDADPNGLFRSSKWPKYAPVAFFGYDAHLMPDDVLSSPQLKIATTPETIGNLSTYKVSAPFEITNSKYEMTYWLSPERSCLPVKTEVTQDGRLKRRMKVKEFLELGDGRWAIKSLMQQNFVTKPGETTPIELCDITYTLRKVELHPAMDEEKVFSTSPSRLLAGVDVIDHVKGSRYFVGEDAQATGETLPATPDR